MTRSLSFTIPGDAVPFARAGSKGGHRYTPTKQANHQAVVMKFASDAMAGQPLFEGPLRVLICVFYARPKSRKKDTWKVTRPDADNLAKAILDPLDGVVWRDDAQVAYLTVSKNYGDQPRTEVRIEVLT